MEISQKIIDYGIWYYLKYYPSPKKLEQKLIEKFGPNSENGEKYGGIGSEEIEYIIKEKMFSIIQEEEVIKSKIRGYKTRGKSKLYIKQKLFSRQENRDLIEQFLEEEFADGEIENLNLELEKIIKKLKLDLENINFEEKSKIVQRLMMKGFKYDDIKKVIN